VLGLLPSHVAWSQRSLMGTLYEDMESYVDSTTPI